MNGKHFNIMAVSYLIGMVYGSIPVGSPLYNIPLVIVTLGVNLLIVKRIEKK